MPEKPVSDTTVIRLSKGGTNYRLQGKFKANDKGGLGDEPEICC